MVPRVCISDSSEVSISRSLCFSVKSSIHHTRVGQTTKVAMATTVYNLVLSYEMLDLISSLGKDQLIL